ncbi:hypothetical protein [Amycolatopsis sp.]|uniref:hypothetical protein n=1 Tax=Amycolatopsis sp. TaxID=37632 RepID=UPI0026291E3B|nr:hypothetical protein [Amycolatopsis sp.]
MTPPEDTETEPDAEREERRRLRRRRRARLKAAALGRSRGGLTCKVHLSADRRCRPLSFVVTGLPVKLNIVVSDRNAHEVDAMRALKALIREGSCSTSDSPHLRRPSTAAD